MPKKGTETSAVRWRDDNSCTLDGKPAKVVGWNNEFATVGTLDGSVDHEWSWEAVDRIMSKDRQFKS